MERIVEIDVGSVRERRELHELLFQNLGFPAYYGGNWDAFDECIRDPGLGLPDRVVVRGMASLEAALPREAALFRECATARESLPSFSWDG